MTDDLSFPSSARARPPRLADDAPAPHEGGCLLAHPGQACPGLAPGGDALGRPLNPDTNLPYPTASASQEQLADELLARLLDVPGLLDSIADRDLIRDALVEVAVRQHGRTLRACSEELRSQADGFDKDARVLAASAVSEGPVVDSGRLGSASRLAAGAATLRTVLLRADRA